MYGGRWEEKIGLNEESLISGRPQSLAEQARSFAERAPAAREMRAALTRGQVREAERAAAKLVMGKVRPYEYLGQLLLEVEPLCNHHA